MKQGHYFGWADSGKRSVEDKIADALEEYRERFGRDARVVLVHPDNLTAYPDVEVRAVSYLQRQDFLVGQDIPVEAAPVVRAAPEPQPKPVKSPPKEATRPKEVNAVQRATAEKTVANLFLEAF